MPVSESQVGGLASIYARREARRGDSAAILMTCGRRNVQSGLSQDGNRSTSVTSQNVESSASAVLVSSHSGD